MFTFINCIYYAFLFLLVHPYKSFYLINKNIFIIKLLQIK